eukprot:6106422-Pyramimonas_sp.AAC.2
MKCSGYHARLGVAKSPSGRKNHRRGGKITVGVEKLPSGRQYHRRGADAYNSSVVGNLLLLRLVTFSS